jgi:hypothetical protein
MLPFVRDGDVARIRAAEAGEVAVGEVICYEADGDRLVLHRLVHRDGDRLIARGDALLIDEPVDPARLIGRLVALERAGRVLRLDSSRARRVGRAIATVAPLLARLLPAARAARRAWYTRRG